MIVVFFLLLLVSEISCDKKEVFKDENYVRSKLKLLRRLTFKRLVKQHHSRAHHSLRTLSLTADKMVKDPKGQMIDDVNHRSGISGSLFQGDIVLTRKQVDGIVANSVSSRTKRQSSTGYPYPKNLWKNPISYYFADGFDEKVKELVRFGLKLWSRVTCLKFVENSTARDRIQYFHGDGCYSSLGRIGGKQQISLGDGCHSIGHVLHETGHALGFVHAQARNDRDDHIEVVERNILEDWVDQFAKLSKAENNNFGIQYDYGSIMHYGGRASSSDPNNMNLLTMRALQEEYQGTMGSFLLSFYDVQLMNTFYKCTCPARNHCKNGGYPNPANCSACNCPSAFGGQYCERRPDGCGREIQATSQFKQFTDTIGNDGEYFERLYKECHYWIKSPPGTVIELRVDSFSEQACNDGCIYGGVEVKAQKDLKMTGYRFCCEERVVKHTYKSHTNLLPIKTFNRYEKQTVTFSYRYVRTSSSGQPIKGVCEDKYATCRSLRDEYDLCGNTKLGTMYTEEKKKKMCGITCKMC